MESGVITEVIKKLIGPIDPVGETHTDDKRYVNLCTMINVIDELLFDINRVVPNSERQEYSMKRSGDKAKEFFKSINDIYIPGENREG